MSSGSPVGQQIVTTSTAMRQLRLNRRQVHRLVQTHLLVPTGRYGRAHLLDPVALEALARRPVLDDAAGPEGDEPREAYALGLHLDLLRRDTDPANNGRIWAGWDALAVNNHSAWTGWWNTGAAIAEECAAAALPILPAVSGIIVDVGVITGWTPHPVIRGLVRFEVAPAPESVRQRFAPCRFLPHAGAPWQRLWQSVAA